MGNDHSGAEERLRNLLERLLDGIGAALIEDSFALFPVGARPGQCLLVVSEHLDGPVAQIAHEADLHRAADHPGVWLHVPKA